MYSALNVFLFYETDPFDFGIGVSVSSTDSEQSLDHLVEATLSWGVPTKEGFWEWMFDFECGSNEDNQGYFTVTVLGFNLRATWTKKSSVKPPGAPK